MHDMPLVIFTVLSQLAIGGFVTLWWIDQKSTIQRKTGLLISLSLVVIGGIAVLVSLFHLGHPFAAYRAILNIKVSWLSREVTFYGAFVGLSMLYSWFWIKDAASWRGMTGAVATILGILAIFSSAKIYMIPAIPAWNSMTTMFMFFLTSILLGPLFVGVFLIIRGELSMNLTAVVIVGFIAATVVMLVYFSGLQGGLPQAAESLRLAVGQLIFWVRLFTFIIAFAILAITAIGKQKQTGTIYTVVFVLILISEFLARLQFYETAVHL
ncbi:DmsC/YnfH family molybdoenzyme membrane anchor subunit [Neobacillus niacini]|uniref:dimethyl sulfoxide reductase anchor subunit family protein n=1 Tax=Neobacillus niacini TaxID=86668 RepID=UPI0021CB8DA0|nr:DmsC/YnfH family molybdoenzyme membrane anchor subunit [Neobacillus niacini]MCM3768470.1 dimethyl sulfoxide reductase anchor subunit [Neobacillus niacini]